MKRFTAEIHHTYDTILRMCRTQDDTFFFKRKLLMAFAGVVLAVFGVWNMQSVAGILFAMIGCFMLTSLNQPAKNQADNIRQALGGVYPYNRYEFYDKHFVLLAQNHDVVGYDKLVRLVEDDGYFYLCINEQAGYMLEKASLGASLADFRAFIQKATGLSFVRPYKLSTFSLKTIISMIRDERKKK